MEYIIAKRENAEEIYKLVRDTIKTIYPKYYPQEVVEFFCHLHNKENILKDIENGLVGMLVDNNRLIGTGSYKENHITRVYVSPKFQRQGYGSYIMQSLESSIALKYNVVYLDASLSASQMYEKRGYVTQKHEKMNVENGAVLVYEVMQKELNKNSTAISYNRKKFMPI